jgi:hypothetical protein
MHLAQDMEKWWCFVKPVMNGGKFDKLDDY